MANKSGASFKEPPPPAPKGKSDAAAKSQTVAAAATSAAAPAPKAEEAPKAEAAPAKTASATAPASDAAVNPEGEKLYKTVCFACHASGVMGAPTFGSKEKWAPFIPTGHATMGKNAIHGVGARPPRGGPPPTHEQDSKT